MVPDHSASMPDSPVRMRIACSIDVTKILPSPILPVPAALRIVSTAALDQGVVDHDLDLHLGQEAHGVLGAAIDLGLALLAAEAFDLADRQALDAERGQRVAHLVQLERLEDRHDHFHCRHPPGGAADF